MKKKIDTPNEINGTFFFDPEDKIYKDHFPSGPVVPGSLIVHAFLEAVDKIDSAEKNCEIKNFRFTKFIPPGEYDFIIKIKSDYIKCKLYDNNELVANGTIII